MTQEARCYKLPLPNTNRNIVFIDTCVMGDARGPEQDNKNFRELQQMLKREKVDHIHSVLVVLYTNYQNANQGAQLSLKSIFGLLQDDMDSEWLQFVFTHTAHAELAPGDSLTGIRTLANNGSKKYLDYKVPITTRSTVYAVKNNWLVQFLLYKKKIPVLNMKSVSEEWTISSAEINRIIKKLISCHYKSY